MIETNAALDDQLQSETCADERNPLKRSLDVHIGKNEHGQEVCNPRCKYLCKVIIFTRLCSPACSPT